MEIGGAALPWIDAVSFARRAIDLAIEDLSAARSADGWTFFDRGLVDAAAALRHVTGEDLSGQLCRRHRYRGLVFFAPPWPELYAADRERRHDFNEAVAEYGRLQAAYPDWGYELCVLPKAAIEERADFVEAVLPLR
jgi:predicted ATPase